MAKNKWVEIISVRLFSPDNKKKVREIIEHVWSGRCPETGKKICAELYVNREQEQDLSIHMFRNGDDGAPRKTSVGSCIADMFARLGLVSHSVWKTDFKKERHKEKI